MSRLAGFIAYIDDKEVFNITWKNYLNVDTTIIYHAYQHKLTTITKDIDENFEMVYVGSGAFYWTYQYLCKTLNDEYWNTNDIMQHDKHEARTQWCMILNTIDKFLKTPFDKPLTIKFFECN